MDYTVLQAPANAERVIDGLGTLAPGWSDRDAVEHARGWTSVRLGRTAAARFAPLLARLLRRDLLVWTVDSERCRVSWYRENGDVLEADDRNDQVEVLVEAFGAGHAPASGESDSNPAVPSTAAISSAPSPADRHKELATQLGVPHLIPAAAPRPIAATPAFTGPGMSLGEERFRRQRRIRNTSSWLHFASGICVVAAVAMVIRGPLIGAGIALVAAGLLQVVRFLLGRLLPRAT